LFFHRAIQKAELPFIGSPAIFKPKRLQTSVEKTRDFPSQFFNWFGFYAFAWIKTMPRWRARWESGRKV